MKTSRHEHEEQNNDPCRVTPGTRIDRPRDGQGNPHSSLGCNRESLLAGSMEPEAGQSSRRGVMQHTGLPTRSSGCESQRQTLGRERVSTANCLSSKAHVLRVRFARTSVQFRARPLENEMINAAICLAATAALSYWLGRMQGYQNGYCQAWGEDQQRQLAMSPRQWRIAYGHEEIDERP